MFLSCNRKREVKTHFYFSFSITCLFLLVFIKFLSSDHLPQICYFLPHLPSMDIHLSIRFHQKIKYHSLWLANMQQSKPYMHNVPVEYYDTLHSFPYQSTAYNDKKRIGQTSSCSILCIIIYFSVFTFPVYCSHPDSSTATSTNLRTSRQYHTVLPSQVPSSQGLHPNSKLRYRLHGEV